MPSLFSEVRNAEGERGLSYNLHEGQRKAWDSTRRTVAIIAGARGGKTSFGPLWLHREMQMQGPGDYLVAAPSYPLLDKGAVPEVKAFLGGELGLGEVRSHPLQFVFSERGQKRLWGKVSKRQPRIIFGHAADPDSLEAMTAKAAWLDECGQKDFKIGSYEAIIRRLAINEGRMLITTTPYMAHGWLKTRVWDKWRAGDPTIDVIQFTSLMNPAFPKAEYERAEKILPPWKFALSYKGELTKPAGLIYDSFNEVKHTCPRFALPESWNERYLGIDFGGVNTAAVYWARHPMTGVLYLYRVYKAGNRTAKEHVAAMLEGEPYEFEKVVGGSKSEGQWRQEFRDAGLAVHEPPISDVETGINRTYAMFKEDKVQVFMDEDEWLDEVYTYSREVDDEGEPTEKIEEKQRFHRMDATRYIFSWLHDYDTDGAVPFVVGTKAQ